MSTKQAGQLYERIITLLQEHGSLIFIPSSMSYGLTRTSQMLRWMNVKGAHCSVGQGKIYMWLESTYPGNRMTPWMRAAMDATATVVRHDE